MKSRTMTELVSLLIRSIWLCLLCATTAWAQSESSPGHTLFRESIDAVVNDEIILASEVDDRVEWIAQNHGLDLGIPSVYEDTRERVLDEMIKDLLIYQWGVEHGMELRKDQLTRRIDAELQTLSENEQIKNQGGLEAALKRIGRSMESYRKSFEKSIQREYVINQAIRLNIDEKVNLTDAYIERQRINNPDVFRRGQNVTVTQIFLKCPQDAPAETQAEVAAKAEDIYLRIKAGADFLEMVHRYSQHPAARRQDKGTITYSRGELAKPFDIAFSLQEGQICEPFRTAVGYHILRLERKQSIEEYLRGERRKEMLAAWMKELGEKSVIFKKAAEPQS